ncbi:MAG TPA: methylated-DNA--[protein]-cysteine S-methyltransferase [Polyangiaceae bacterium]
MTGTRFALFETAIGPCGAVWSARGLAAVLLPEADRDATRARLVARFPDAREARPDGAARDAIAAMKAHLAGKLDAMEAIELDYSAVPLFHRRVYEALRRVLPGQTVGYGELAARVGSPGAARAVGQAVGKNPFPVVVPCQRVLAAGGKAGGFSAHGGVATKQRMLAIEGVSIAVPQKKAPSPPDHRAALAHLRRADARLAKVIDRVGPPQIRQMKTASTFEALAESIVYQQLNGKAAATIHGRLAALFPGKRLRPEALLALEEDLLRGAGLSRSKLAALRDLSQKTLDGVVPSVKALHALGDEEIVERLVQVRGIGRWTVEMLLIFRLGRQDVLPVGDFGVRNGFKLAYGKKEMPSPKELAKHGEKWAPYRSVAAWYMWRAVDLAKKKEPTGRG